MKYKPLPIKPKPKESRSLRPSSRQTYEVIQTKALLEGKSTEEIFAWAEKNIHAGLPRGTVLTRYSAIKHLLLERGYSPLDLKDALPSYKLHSGDTKKFPLGEEHVEIFLQAVRTGIRHMPTAVLLNLLLYTGLRVSEACNLKRSDIVWDQGVRSLQVLGKGGKRRVIPLTPRASKMLDRYLASEHPPLPWLFYGTESQAEPISRKTINSACYRIKKTHPELGKLSPHTLRHTFATTLFNRGVSLIVISRLLGHASIAQTERYIGLDPKLVAEQMAAAMQKVGKRSAN